MMLLVAREKKNSLHIFCSRLFYLWFMVWFYKFCSTSITFYSRLDKTKPTKYDGFYGKMSKSIWWSSCECVNENQITMYGRYKTLLRSKYWLMWFSSFFVIVCLCVCVLCVRRHQIGVRATCQRFFLAHDIECGHVFMGICWMNISNIRAEATICD